jgi:hypothetical protein
MEDNIKMNEMCGSGLDETRSGSCTMEGFGISCTFRFC